MVTFTVWVTLIGPGSTWELEADLLSTETGASIHSSLPKHRHCREGRLTGREDRQGQRQEQDLKVHRPPKLSTPREKDAQEHRHITARAAPLRHRQNALHTGSPPAGPSRRTRLGRSFSEEGDGKGRKKHLLLCQPARPAAGGLGLEVTQPEPMRPGASHLQPTRARPWEPC